MMIKSYIELINFKTFEERFEYLKISGHVGKETFGHKRFMNQKFYMSNEWRKIRAAIIDRDMGCDLGIIGMEIGGYIYIHHINPLTIDDFINMSESVYDFNNLICVSKQTHAAIHYGNRLSLPIGLVERKPNDTKIW